MKGTTCPSHLSLSICFPVCLTESPLIEYIHCLLAFNNVFQYGCQYCQDGHKVDRQGVACLQDRDLGLRNPEHPFILRLGSSGFNCESAQVTDVPLVAMETCMCCGDGEDWLATRVGSIVCLLQMWEAPAGGSTMPPSPTVGGPLSRRVAPCGLFSGSALICCPFDTVPSIMRWFRHF